MEEYFYDFYKKNKKMFDKTGRTLIPIFWTNLYINQFPNNIIQTHVDNLPAGKYFTVCQYDDGIQENLPEDTINFVAGGNKPGLPIPLICSPIPEEYKTPNTKKDIFCSFVGTYLNTEKYSCRLKTYETYKNDKDFYFSTPREWNRIVTNNQFKEFCEITQRSHFTLCPRGYGLQSFRLYEAIQLGSIPVFIYNKPFLPFELLAGCNWNEFSVLVHENNINILKDLLNDISDARRERMISIGREIYNQYFNMNGMCNGILQTLECGYK